MLCSTCGAATQITESSGGIKDGSFQEIHECANGHIGRITGEASDPPQKWTKTGPVFNEAIQ